MIDSSQLDLDAFVGVDPSDTHERLGSAGDGLPVAAISEERIATMIQRCGRSPEEVVVAVPPLRQPLTVRDLAICSGLAGCAHQHLPVLIAATSMLANDELNAYGFTTTTGSAAPVLIVSGPKARELGFNAGPNCLGPGNVANASVGRALSLVLRIVGGARAGLADMATLGQPAKYTCCFAENEEQSPWPPFCADRGFAADESTVTVSAISGIVETFEASSGDPDDMIGSIAAVLAGSAPIMASAAGDPVIGGGQPIVVLTPEWAQHFERSGLGRTDLRAALFQRAERVASDGEVVRVARRADDVLVVVAGGVGVKQAVMPNWNGGSRAVTGRIESLA